MKILFDSKIFFHQKFGGPARYFFNLFENLNLIGESAYILSPIYSTEYLKYSSFKSNIIGINFPKIKYSGILLDKINSKLSTILFKKINPEIIHTTDYYDLDLNSKKPIIVTVHDLIHEIFHYEFAKDKNYRPKKNILDIANHVICGSENTKRDLIRYYSIEDNKISVIYYGNSFINKDYNKTDKLNFDLNYQYFLYVGSRKRYKNFYTLIDAFKKKKEIYSNFKIICFGGGDFLESEKKILNEKNFDLDKLVFLQNSDDNLLYYLYKNACALIYPSLHEGFGMPILEAMSSGCPVISSNSSSLPEVYGNAAESFPPIVK